MTTRVCTGCKEEKLLEVDFPFRKDQGFYSRRCRVCTRKLQNLCYNRKREKYRKRIVSHFKKRQEEYINTLLLFLREHPCAVCGERDPIVLEFHHVDASTKRCAVSNMICSGKFSWNSIQAEMGKCQVLCANCHRRKTAIKFKWRMLKLIEKGL